MTPIEEPRKPNRNPRFHAELKRIMRQHKENPRMVFGTMFDASQFFIQSICHGLPEEKVKKAKQIAANHSLAMTAYRDVHNTGTMERTTLEKLFELGLKEWDNYIRRRLTPPNNCKT